MTDLEIMQAVKDATENAYQIAEKTLSRTFTRPKIVFNLRGTCAGRAISFIGHPELPTTLRYNLGLARDNLQDFLENTVKHEVAHLIDFLYFGRSSVHGRNWKYIMLNVFGIPAERCHSYDVSKHRARRTFLHLYRCSCGADLKVGSKYHKRIQNNQIVYHTKCRLQISRAWYKGKIDRHPVPVI